MANILEKQKIEVVKAPEKSAEEIARKQAILAQYAHVESGEEYPFMIDIPYILSYPHPIC